VVFIVLISIYTAR